ncbi:MAG: pirin family protein [Microthrixaceae bacterium]
MTLQDPMPEPEVWSARQSQVGAATVYRALPQRPRRTVGTWCFLDYLGPGEPAEGGPGIGPHPHIGLQTVTWMISGEMLHRDSLGSEQVIRAGELNLMTAGRGIVHAEERVGDGPVELAQLWVAQPSSTRNSESAFEHHDDLQHVEFGDAEATVLVGELGGVASAARRDTDHFGADLTLHGHATVPLDTRHEHVLVPIHGAVRAGETTLEAPQLLYLPTGRSEVGLSCSEQSRLLMLGGEPFDEKVLMWWNYVGRTREEVSEAHLEWTTRSERFMVPDSALPSIDVDPPPWETR